MPSRLRREIKKALDRRRQGEADVVFWPYVAPAGRNLHIVQNPHTGQEVLVSSAAGSRSFKPGASVPIGSESGRGGRTILGLPPVDRVGTHETGIPTSQVIEIGDPRIIDCDPAEVERGATTSATLTGVLLGDWIAQPGKLRAVSLEEDTGDIQPDLWVSVTNVAYVDPETVTCDLVASGATPDGYMTRFEVRR